MSDYPTNQTVQSIWYTEPGAGVAECVGLELNGQKRFFRIWPETGETDWGWLMHETAKEVWR